MGLPETLRWPVVGLVGDKLLVLAMVAAGKASVGLTVQQCVLRDCFINCSGWPRWYICFGHKVN